MTRPGIELWPPGPLANTLLIRPMARFNVRYIGIIIISLLTSFYTSVSWWSLRSVLEKASPLRSLRLFKEFLLILTMLIFYSSSSFFRHFGDRSKYTNCYWYYCQFYVPHVLSCSGKIQIFINVLAFFYFHSMTR